MFFKDWYGILRVLIGCLVAYAFLVLALRLGGKRVLSKMNAFDMIVTVALGSTLATVIVSKQVPLAEGLLAISGLILLQFVVAKSSAASRKFQKLVKAEPRILFRSGEYNEAAMSDERITHSEVLQAVRSQGIASLDEVEAVVLETNGQISVITKYGGPVTALQSAR